MDQDRPTALRGFDSYDLRLGDELRGQRATLGKSLLDVQRELRIKAAYVDAIENGDPGVVPNPGFVPGYVRAYARYLDLDPEAVYKRFCEENGFVGQTSRMAQTGSAPKGGLSLGAGALGADKPAGPETSLSRSHFASPIGRARPVGLGVSASDIASVAVLIALLGGLGWGGWALLKDIQRVEFAPANEAPEVAFSAPGAGGLPGLADASEDTPWIATGPEREAALAELYSPHDGAPPPQTEFGDGPIAAIDPETSGLFAPPPAESARRFAAAAAPPPGPETAVMPGAPPGDPEILTASLDASAAGAVAAGDAPGLTVLTAAEPGLWLVAQAECWVQVRAGDGSVLMERILQQGETWQAPDDVANLTLRAGNAGGLMIRVDGALHGPLGRSGEVIRSVSLVPEAVRERFARAEAAPAAPATDAPRQEASAAAALPAPELPSESDSIQAPTNIAAPPARPTQP
ncbi:MAG: helix-turn-helix domain-containing protein [Pseudomonadota bacterium]